MKRLFRRAGKRILDLIGINMPVRFGSLRRVTPISRSFGMDRGRPIDRYYIESFIRKHQKDIKGHVIEAGGYVNYTRQFGGNRVKKADVLYPKEGHKDATIVGDLTTGEGIPIESVDCLILTQVFPFIYDIRAAIAYSHRALKHGGVVLATVPGISQICRYDMENWGDYWRFTDSAVRRLFADVFGPENISVEARGNVLVACAFLYGLATQDLTEEELDSHDPDYQFMISVRAVKTETNGSSTGHARAS